MNSKMKLLISGLMILALAGCVSPGALIAPPSPELRARMDRVVLEVSASGKPNWISTDTVKVGAGDRAASAAGKGAAAGIYPIEVLCNINARDPEWVLLCPVGIILGAATAAVGGLGGGIYGAATARTQGEMESAESALDKALRETRPEDVLRNRVASGIRSRTSVSVFEVETHEALAERQSHDAAPGLAVVLDVQEFNLSRKGEMSPDLWLDLVVSARMYDSLANPSLYSRQWELKTNLGDFFRVTNAGAANLGTKLNAEIGKMAAAIVDDLFVTKVAKALQPVPSNGQVVTTGADTETYSSMDGLTVAPIAAGSVAPLPSVSWSQPVSTAPAATAAPAPSSESDQFLKVGDRWKYKFNDRGRDAGSVTVEIVESSGRKVRERFTREGYQGFVAEREIEAVFSPRRFQAPIALPGGYLLTELAPYLPPDTELKAGQVWDSVPGIFFISDIGKKTMVSQVRVVGQETVRVPAGAFPSWRIEAESEDHSGIYPAKVKCTFWYSSEMKRTMKMTIDSNRLIAYQSGGESYELVSFDRGK